MAAALRKAGQRNFSDRSFVQPLKRLLRSYAEEADLNELGRAVARYDVMRGLTNLLLLDMAEMRNPEIARRQIDRPIFITGFPRSASTFLHKLLSLDPTIAVPHTWELIYPYPAWDRVGETIRKLQVEAELRLFRAFSPGLAELHKMGADEPQECIDITAQVFQSTRYDDQFRVPGYQCWLEKHGHDQAYRFHRRFLQHLGLRKPHRRWVLKAPRRPPKGLS
jgi:Sulfotransferase family